MTKLHTLLLSALLAASLLLGGCHSATVQATGTETASMLIQAPAPCLAPLSVVVLLDKTGSANQNLTPQIASADFDPLYDRIVHCGGEIAVGLVTTRSNRPLLRLRIDEPDVNFPAETDRKQNPYKYARERVQEVKDRAQAAAALQARETDAAAMIQAFSKAAAPLLVAAANSFCSDVFGALNRAALFHSEPAALWKQAPRRFTALVSDAQHNCGEARVASPSGVTLLMVNGAAGNGSLPPGLFVRLESWASGVRLITAEEKH